MKILLIGDYGGLHSTLADGLRRLGHEVCVASDGNGWKNYPRDIALDRKRMDFVSGVGCVARIALSLPRLRGFDVVQVTHCPFVPLRPIRTLPLYRYLRRHNGKLFMGAFGTDHYYVRACMRPGTYRYSDFRIGDRPLNFDINSADIGECLQGGTVWANREIASTCDGIVACLWEYYAAYKPYFPDKTTFIPLPFNMESVTSRVREVPERINFFIGIQSARHRLKGTDVMLDALREVVARHPESATMTTVQDVPYAQYIHEVAKADVMLDQLYSYTPAMNALTGMAQGVTVCGGGEPENYEILNERELRPIINLLPERDDVCRKLEGIIAEPQRIPQLSAQSIEYVRRHHDHVKVAEQYLKFWLK
jgi:hypothetical protein